MTNVRPEIERDIKRKDKKNNKYYLKNIKKYVIISLVFCTILLSACGNVNDTANVVKAEETAVKSTPEPTPTPFPDYDFEVYGKTFNTADIVIDLNHVTVEDNGEELKKYLPDCHNLKILDMDFCGVDNEHMAQIRDEYPDVNVVWRVWFGENYSVRTDVEKILASNPGLGGNLFDDNCEGLYYCTKVKYLDVGHNNFLRDISFVKNMPDLEVFIIAQDCSYERGFKDLSPLSECPKLEFLEVQGTMVSDLSPLSGLTNLRHFNAGACPYLHSIEPIMDLELERLWTVISTPIPIEQIKQYRQLHPDALVDNFSAMPNDGWKKGAERYALLQEQFGYRELDYQLKDNDPLYYEHESIYTPDGHIIDISKTAEKE